MIRLTSRERETSFLFSVRPRHPYLALYNGKGPKTAAHATHSVFDMNLSKHLKGTQLTSIEALPKERIAVLWFGELGLVLSLIPATPEALLVESTSSGWKILARTKTSSAKTSSDGTSIYVPPSGSRAPENPPLREELPRWTRIIESALDDEAFELRLKILTQTIQGLLKQARDRVRQSSRSLNEAENEPDWNAQADSLKTTFPYPATEIEKTYQLAKRKQRRVTEARNRVQTFNETLQNCEKALHELPKPGDWASLEKLERRFALATSPLAPKQKKSKSSWLGKTFVSQDRLPIWVGRSKDENLELTFKHARGNDLWMHVRGRPGAHVVIPLPSGKSAPLETLLDAATLAVHYSGGEKWGKTEVDYTFKKHVKRIKDSTEASYTHNKTLIIDVDPARLKRLTSQNT